MTKPKDYGAKLLAKLVSSGNVLKFKTGAIPILDRALRAAYKRGAKDERDAILAGIDVDGANPFFAVSAAAIRRDICARKGGKR